MRSFVYCSLTCADRSVFLLFSRIYLFFCLLPFVLDRVFLLFLLLLFTFSLSYGMGLVDVLLFQVSVLGRKFYLTT